MSAVDIFTFNQYVDFACETVKIMHKQYGERLADVWVHRYARDCAGDDRNVFVQELIMCSETESEAWKALQLIVLYHRLHETPLPENLDLWTSLAAGEIRGEPQTTGTDAHTKFVRNMAIVVVVFLLTEVEGFKATRSPDGLSECGYEGGSACDVVGKALADLKGLSPDKSLKYKTIETIWSAAASPHSPLYRYGPSRRPFIEHPRFLLMDLEKSDDGIGPSENLMELPTLYRIIQDVLSAVENN